MSLLKSLKQKLGHGDPSAGLVEIYMTESKSLMENDADKAAKEDKDLGDIAGAIAKAAPKVAKASTAFRVPFRVPLRNFFVAF